MGGASGVAAAPCALPFATPANTSTQTYNFLKCPLGISVSSCLRYMTQHKST